MIIWRARFLKIFKHIKISAIKFSGIIEGSVLDLRLQMVQSFVNKKNCAKTDGLIIPCKGKLIDEGGKVFQISNEVTNLDWMVH